MFKRFTNGCVQVVNRWLPDPFLFAIILTIVVFIAAMIGTQQGPLELVWSWGGQGEVKDGFWSLLSFAMQMALVLVLGSAMASAKACKKALAAIATLAHDKKSAILVTTFVSTICCWLNWGFGLIAGALLAKGWLLGVQFQSFITSIDHWIAFVLLGLIGINMIRESRSTEEEEMETSFGAKAMFPLAVATSIDALAVGVTFAFLQVEQAEIVSAVSFIGVITFVLSAVGVKVGAVFGARFRSRAELAGRLILILMGLKILLEHTVLS